jgi:acyl carrier protein
MDAPRRERLLEFVRGRLEEAHSEGIEPLTDETSLLRSRLLDSLAILQLADWIDTELGVPLDLQRVDLAAEWDTIASILAFVLRHGGRPE